MEFSLNLDQTRGLGNLEAFDIIEFESEFVDLDIFMVVSVEKDDSIPAILLQLWKFDGGYNHEFKNVMENDLGLNKQVTYFTPKKKLAVIEEIATYRPENSGLSKKEELFFDVWPQTTSSELDTDHTQPFEVNVRFEDGKTETIIIPTWTPLQRLPVDKIKTGTEVEVWVVDDISNIMKVNKL